MTESDEEGRRPNDDRKGWIVSSLPEIQKNLPIQASSTSPLSQKAEEGEESSSSSTTVKKNKQYPTRLILHFDINETILLGDDAGGDTRQDSLQKLLAKSAFCQYPSISTATSTTTTTSDSSSTTNENKDEDYNDYIHEIVYPTHWWDGQVIGEETSLPPLYTGWDWPKGCLPYYRTAYKKYSKHFVQRILETKKDDDIQTKNNNDDDPPLLPSHGHIYHPILEECEYQLAKNGLVGNYILPAFYYTLESLVYDPLEQSNSKSNNNRLGDSVRLVFRTFGSDLAHIANIITEFAQGKHPKYPHIHCPQLELSPDRLFQGRWKSLPSSPSSSSSSYVYELWNTQETQVFASGDEEILKFLKSFSICGIRDDYHFWAANNWDPTAGKPVWVSRYDNGDNNNLDMDEQVYEHHLFFDDNIHNIDDDGIVCVRKQREDLNQNPKGDDGSPGHSDYSTLKGSMANQQIHGVHMIRVPTIEPILNPGWYLQQIEKAQNKLQVRLREARDDKVA